MKTRQLVAMIPVADVERSIEFHTLMITHT